MAIMRNWAVCHRGSEFLAPELWVDYLAGNVYGHPRFNDGDSISTSRIIGIRAGERFKVVSTKNTEYIVHESDVDPEYERLYPGAYARLSLTVVDCA